MYVHVFLKHSSEDDFFLFSNVDWEVDSFGISYNVSFETQLFGGETNVEPILENKQKLDILLSFYHFEIGCVRT